MVQKVFLFRRGLKESKCVENSKKWELCPPAVMRNVKLSEYKRHSESRIQTIQFVCSGKQNKAAASSLLLKPLASRLDGCIWGERAGWGKGTRLPGSFLLSGRILYVPYRVGLEGAFWIF